MSGRRSSAYMASILALISAVLITSRRLRVLGVDTKVVGIEGVAMGILPSCGCGAAAAASVLSSRTYVI